MQFNHALEKLSIIVTDIDESNAFATFSIIGMLDPFYSGETIFTQFDRNEQEDVVKQIIVKIKLLNEKYSHFRVKEQAGTITVVASNTKGFDSMNFEECLSELFFVIHDALSN